jgi:hypothetical protein
VERLYRKPRFAIEWKNHFLKLIKCCPHPQDQSGMEASGESPSIRDVF